MQHAGANPTLNERGLWIGAGARTRPVMQRAVLYFSAMEGRRSHRNAVVAIMLASVKEVKLYTSWCWLYDMLYIMMGDVFTNNRRRRD